MEEIIKILQTRKEELKKECWSNKIRINEIETIIDMLKNTPVAGTTDVKIVLDEKSICRECLKKNLQSGQQIIQQMAY